MLNLFGCLLLSTILVGIVQCDRSRQFIGRTCRPDSTTTFGVCIPAADCENGHYVPDTTPAIDQSAAIRCPSSLTCCIPTQREPETKPGCGWLQPGEGTAVEGLAKRNEVPWTVGIYVPLGKQGVYHKMRFISNGVLIHERAVLTVANKAARYSNLVPSGVYVAVGEYDQRAIRGKKAFKVQEVVVHDQYNEASSEFNLALLILRTPVKRSAACLPSAPARAVQCFFTGWGNDTDFVHQHVLTKTQASIIPYDECALALRPYLGRRYRVRPSLVCARGAPLSDLCKGDAGSPLVCPVEGSPGRYELAGLVSYVADCGPKGLPVVFSNVHAAKQWIDSTLAARGLTVST